MSGTGHNGQLSAIVERIERLEEEKATLLVDIGEIYKEAKGNGFDVKALRAIVRRRKQDADKLREHEAIVETYLVALGEFISIPLGRAAAERATA